MMRRRMGRALVAGAVVGGVAHHAGRVSAENDMREQQQSAQLADMQMQQDQMNSQMQAQQQQAAMAAQQAQVQAQAEQLAAQMVAQQQAQQMAAPPPPQAAPPPPAPAPAAAAPAQTDKIAQLKELGELKASGILTEEEFQAEKAKILNS